MSRRGRFRGDPKEETTEHGRNLVALAGGISRGKRYPKAIAVLERGMEHTLTTCAVCENSSTDASLRHFNGSTQTNLPLV